MKTRLGHYGPLSRPSSVKQQCIWIIALVFVGLLQYTVLRRESKYHSKICNHSICYRSHTNRPMVPNNEHMSQHNSQVELFWKSFFVILEQHAPKCSPIVQSEVADSKGLGLVAARPRIIDLSPEDLACLKTSHAGFHQAQNETFPNLPFIRGTRGIVTTVTGRYLRTVIISIRILRRSGNTLPVEVFLSTKEEMDPLLCGTIFPALNARCLLLSTVIHDRDVKSFHRFQYKTLAILSSTFEDVLFIDADNLIVNNAEELFTWNQYLETGMIAWPDLWASTASPDMTVIQGIPELHYWNRGTYETGQFLVSKSKHKGSLLVAAYYNMFGPDYYYPLLSQGAIGQGDKETFVAAAQGDGKRYYLTEKLVQATGFYDRHWWYSALIQWHPMDDEVRPHSKQRPLFIHASFPKLDAAEIMELPDGCVAMRYENGKGKSHRLWDGLEKADLVTSLESNDVESIVWQELEAVACQLGAKIKDWPGDAQKACTSIKKHRKHLFKT